MDSIRKLIGWTEDQQKAIETIIDIKTYYYKNAMEFIADIVSDKQADNISDLPKYNLYNYTHKVYRDSYGVECVNSRRKKKTSIEIHNTVNEFNEAMNILHIKYVESKENSVNETTRKLVKDIIAYLDDETEFV